MKPTPQSPHATAGPRAGSDLRQSVEQLGAELADTLSRVLADLPRRPVGPKILGSVLHITAPTASRLLNAIQDPDPIATVQRLPGPNPLRQVISAARDVGADHAACDAALCAIQAFDNLIHNEAGSRGSLRAMISAWLPDGQKELFAGLRQTIFKALCEIDGVSSELELASFLLRPGSELKSVDIVDIKALLGIDRIRSDAPVQFGTWRLDDSQQSSESSNEIQRPRLPMTLQGEPALDGLHTVRLDAFCVAPPAPLEAQRFGGHMQYSLGPTGFGPASKVDLVMAEVNRNERILREREHGRGPYFFTVPEMATRRLVFDILVHKDLFEGCEPNLYAYDTAGRGPASAGDPKRQLDIRPIYESIESIGTNHRRLRVPEFPRYGELLTQVFTQLDWDQSEFRAWRIEMAYPLAGMQITMAFDGDGD